MQPISKEQEKALDTKGSVTLTHDNVKFDVDESAIYCYGEVNINNSEDVDAIIKFNLVESDGNWVYSGIREDGTIIKPPTFYDTINPIKVWLNAFILIGKPDRIIVYRLEDYGNK